ncbi:thiamine pyrophosphokinase vitamin B1 binding domain [Trypanosoma vivax]|uniref:Thiamin pyrophosphokinase thiamin-binding domain-containing protein n=1 Tax=Trypanosoma vivax (strain Y486) TaxID=1055687 RepID=G0UAQ2_TRYVY|nr:hypothetical protein TRVL_09903 [Trypanosoma vivax]KAH8611733.1 thiamine pyrophosphokinase vitamin B1 binding domain [Trypanosoma vivax]CCC52887.1 conserved hypothetical protein [Trypanosoma vivax Y486]
MLYRTGLHRVIEPSTLGLRVAGEATFMTSKPYGNVRRKVVQHDFYDTAEQVSAVILLNSPSNSCWEYDEYLRFLITKRYSRHSMLNPESAARCYFLCSDGAYPKLLKYVTEEKQQDLLNLFTVFPLCDVVVGDMDSYTSSHMEDGCERPTSTPDGGYATVEAVPHEVLDTIHRRCQSAVAEFLKLDVGMMNDAPPEVWERLRDDLKVSLSPLWVHIHCQFTTDFLKSLKLVSRLRKRYPSESAVVVPPVLCSTAGLELLKTGGDVFSDPRNEGCDHEESRERELCLEACQVEAVLLPTFVVIGAFGGRFDHEMGAISNMLAVAGEAHVVLVSQFDTVFACEANGWTQVVWHPQYEGRVCGLMNYGKMVECETSGMLWNIVKGRGKPSSTDELRFGFGAFLSVCNAVRREVVTIDVRHLQSDAVGAQADSEDNCYTAIVFSIIRQPKK